jgi:hypothetical protein
MATRTAGTATTGNGVRSTLAEDEIDLTTQPVRWTAPGVDLAVREPEPEPVEEPSVADHQHHAWGMILGAGAVLVIILLSSLLGILFNRVDQLENQVDRLQKTVQQN